MRLSLLESVDYQQESGAAQTQLCNAVPATSVTTTVTPRRESRLDSSVAPAHERGSARRITTPAAANGL